MRRVYICDYCGKQFENYTRCRTHEINHVKLKEVLKKNSGFIICPKCEGEGIYWKKEDWKDVCYTCDACEGKGIVMPR